MNGGFLRPACRLLFLAVFAALIAMLSGCSLFGPTEQPPAPITEATVTDLTVPAPVTEPEPEPVEPAGPKEPKKPRPPVVRPHKPEPPPPVVAPAPPPPPPPPPAAPIITTRVLDRNAMHGLLDSEVQKADGKVIGRAVDMTADGSGTPRQMIVNLHGFLGIGDRKAGFPWTAFRFTPNAKGPRITITLPPNQLSAANRAKPSASLAMPLAGVTAAPAVPPGQVELMDTDVERPNGGKVGRVVDVLVDANAQPQAVVLDVSGIISADRRTIAANWSALRFVTKDKTLHPLMDLNDAQIKASPSYEPDKPIHAVSPAPPPAPASAATAGPTSSDAAASTARNSR
ncbi:PRC-barrel domain containing protein [Paraburkholderia sp. LEh10]|uniref:PRC-barrel domain containing protein n=1 Tax=Paraburkholderia sp. LEh10 TaxID=2821353 RepID=UPI001AEB396B|nr:PRC-barrel domain containing protein [Paraburkholderia sp. LEh10]MBP0594393.1 PRC-barrel domain containing protein [Paraburkholderia sp. LEh10]